MVRIAFVVVAPVYAFDLSIAQMVFGAADGYEPVVCTVEPGVVEAIDGPGLVVTAGLDAAAGADTLVVIGGGGRPDVDRRVLDLLRTTSARRIAAICTGTFVVAAAGLLDGRRATTHWGLTDTLARRFPQVTVEPDALYVVDGPVVTSAGAAASIELCLHIVRSDRGVAAGAAAARMTIAASPRPGDQPQLAADSTLAGTRAWALRRLDAPLTLSELASHARMSTRTLTRRFQEETGSSPVRWLLRQRVERARELLEVTDLSMDQIAHRSGLGTADSLRQHVVRRLGRTPSEYRAAHRGGLAV